MVELTENERDALSLRTTAYIVGQRWPELAHIGGTLRALAYTIDEPPLRVCITADPGGWAGSHIAVTRGDRHGDMER